MDLLIISETKIDSSFNDNLFKVEGYKMERRDRTTHGGGLMTFVRSDLPFKRRKDLECQEIETICYELSMAKRKWCIVGAYRKPSLENKVFENDITKSLDQIFLKFDHVICLGDLNYDLSRNDKSQPLINICDTFNLDNIVKQPTCFMKNQTPSLIDVILTNSKTLLCNTANFNCGLSDCHHMIATSLKETCSYVNNKNVTFRSYKNFSDAEFNQELSQVPFHVAHIFDDIDDIYWAHETLLREVLDEQAPLKQKKPKVKSPPYMNSQYRKIIYKTREARNNYNMNKTSENWKIYTKWRNNKTKTKRESISVYFQERCGGGPKSKDFWPTIKPFLSQKSTTKNDSNIILKEGDSLIADQKQVCEKMNTFYVNIAQNIGIENDTPVNDKHPSIEKIKENANVSNFDFQPVTESQVRKCIKRLDSKKATGVDAIPPKIVKAAAPVISRHIASMANEMQAKEAFPTQLKSAQVTPIYKKDDPFTEKNYRPVSILPTLSKIYERLLSEQLTEHFNSIFHDFLSAFRASYGCQTTLLRLVEDWKQALDNNMYVGAILMDLSKAFDCIPHDLLLAKLQAYGVSKHSCNLLASYLSNRHQRVKLGDHVSSWMKIIKGVPQGSILGPLIFNIFINDIFYFLKKCSMYNYADDNTVSYAHKQLTVLKAVVESETEITLNWFDDNQMQANPGKFQAIVGGKKTFSELKSFSVADNTIPCEETVKLLGVELDYQLNFNEQVSRICQKVARQLNVLQRISKFLSEETRLLVFKSFIRSNFNYCPIIWHFCSKVNTEKLEKLQYRGLKIVYNCYESSYEELLTRANLPTLHLGRLRTIALETFKCINNSAPKYIRDLVNLKQSSYSFRYENTLQIPTVRTVAYGQKSFRFEAARVWNSLPNELRKVSAFKDFERLIRTWTGPKCNCAVCHS